MSLEQWKVRLRSSRTRCQQRILPSSVGHVADRSSGGLLQDVPGVELGGAVAPETFEFPERCARGD